jgi:hypothetical protein
MDINEKKIQPRKLRSGWRIESLPDILGYWPKIDIRTYEEDTPKTCVREDSLECQDPKAENNVGGQ